ncbi:hypothetical protein CEXT_778121 [Caerostris extrusa]|uniref:Uncharacterized protein n=1 Tax=Caerostris extrusa TaxID=172846 RepID=A0AAV4R7Y9_CAEEX|nr:hypothetical protein CEXT_778121 [Caerostris extrusa]
MGSDPCRLPCVGTNCFWFQCTGPQLTWNSVFLQTGYKRQSVRRILLVGEPPSFNCHRHSRRTSSKQGKLSDPHPNEEPAQLSKPEFHRTPSSHSLKNSFFVAFLVHCSGKKRARRAIPSRL